ncbi:histidine phosphatase family protein [Variovorax sp. dw_308]|uniref:histidine phosphatase family protein n=3 Tax=unclassified Variovorax TaxID=663243 RepID=UPI001C476800|nr:histidine phosphatase family protein [Variovorax sp. dw_308]
MVSSLRLYLIRHGETVWSLSGRHTGLTDLPLTPHGEQMAQALTPLLKQVSFSRVLSSPRLRARATCSLAELGTDAEIEPDLAEWDYGDYESLRTPEILNKRPGWDIWQDGCPGGEAPADVADRADRLLHRLRKERGNVALFSHGQFGRVLAARWLLLPPREGRHFALDPASLSILGTDADHALRPVISLWNASSSFFRSGA